MKIRCLLTDHTKHFQEAICSLGCRKAARLSDLPSPGVQSLGPVEGARATRGALQGPWGMGGERKLWEDPRIVLAHARQQLQGGTCNQHEVRPLIAGGMLLATRCTVHISRRVFVQAKFVFVGLLSNFPFLPAAATHQVSAGTELPGVHLSLHFCTATCAPPMASSYQKKK